MRFIVSYHTFVTIIEANNLGEARQVVADDLYKYEKNLLRDLGKNEILVNVMAREATAFDEAWYKSRLDR